MITECRSAGHQNGCNRTNTQAYIDAGHDVRTKGRNETVKQTNPPYYRRWQLGEGNEIDNTKYSNVSIDASPMPTPYVIPTSIRKENYYTELSSEGDNDNDVTVVVSNMATTSIDSESLRTNKYVSTTSV